MTGKSVFISYAWDGESRISYFVKELEDALTKKEIRVFLDQSNNTDIGSNINVFIDNIKNVDYIIVALSNTYLKKIHDNRSRVFQEWGLITERQKSENVILPVLYDDVQELPSLIKDLVMYTKNDDLVTLICKRAVEQKESADYVNTSKILYHNPISKDILYSLSEIFVQKIYPEYDWTYSDSSNHLTIEFIDISEDNRFSPQLYVETIYLEGYFDNDLKTIIIFSNAEISTKFKYMSNLHFRKKGKNIQIYDRKTLTKLFHSELETLLRNNSINSYEQKFIKIEECHFIRVDDYNHLNTKFLNTNETIKGKQYMPSLADIQYLKKLYYMTDYYIYITVYAQDESKCAIVFHENAPFVIVHDEFKVLLSKGLNIFTVPIRTIQEGVYRQISFDILSDVHEKITYTLGSFEIDRSIMPRIVFSQQTRIINEVHNLLRKNLHRNANIMLNLLAEGGAGKSHLLYTLIDDVHRYFQDQIEIVNITFKEKSAQKANRDLLAGLMFYIVTGIPYDYSIDFLNTSVVLRETMSQEMLELLMLMKREYTLEQALGILVEVLERDQSYHHIFHISQKKRFLVIDDIQKLTHDYAIVLTRILNYLALKHKDFIVLISGRENELESVLQEFLRSNKTFRLTALSQNDIRSSLCATNPEFNQFIEHSVIDSDLEGFLIYYAIDFIKEISSNNINNLKSFNESVKSALAEIKAPDYVNKMLLGLTDEEFQTLNIIFTMYKLGLEFNSKNKDYKHLFNENNIDRLLNKNLIRSLQGNYLPKHDILVESFPFEYNKVLGEFLEILYQLESNNHEILSELIKCDFSSREVYFTEAIDLTRRYFDETLFGNVLTLTDAINYSLASYPANISKVDKLMIQLMYANSLNFCGSISAAKVAFYEISKQKMIHDETYMGIVLESHTEKLNLDYWHLENPNLIEELQKVRIQTTGFTIKGNRRMENAYLNTYNREMVVSLLFDDLQHAKMLLQKNLELAETFDRYDYKGFALMDFAKGYYNIDPTKSLQYLREAEAVFEQIGQHRRLLDCRCEIAYLETIVDGISIDKLEEISKELHRKNLIQLYVKSLIKIQAVKVFRNVNSLHYFNEFLGKITLYSPDAINNRLSLIIANIDIIKSRKLGTSLYLHNYEQTLQTLHFGNSYKRIIENNRTVNESADIKWAHCCNDDESNCFILDLRVW